MAHGRVSASGAEHGVHAKESGPVRLAYLLFACGIVALGVVHMVATFLSFDTASSEALWFFSGGIAMVLTGVLNLLNRAYGGVAPGVRVASVGANVAMTVFAVVAGLIGRASPGSFAIIVGLVGGTTVLSLIRRSSSRHAT